MFWKRHLGDITVSIEEDVGDYFMFTILDDWAGTSIQLNKDQLHRLVDELQGFVDEFCK